MPDVSRRRRLLGAVAVAFGAGTLVACGEDRAPAVIERSVPWELRSIEGTRLSLRFEAGACAGEDRSVRPRVDERPRRVMIAVIARRRAVARCADLVRIGHVQVTLRAPLSDRSLVHAPVRAGERPRSTPWCPADAPAAERLDARRLIGLTVRAARDLAGDFDCSVRVIERDGRALAHTQDLRRDRINVDVRDRRVLRVRIG